MATSIAMPPILSIENAQCRIGRHCVLKVQKFSIATGQHWCVFGANGTGKSLFANLISGKRVESGSYVRYQHGFDVARDLHIVSFEEQQRLWQRDNRLDVSDFSDDAQDQGTLVESLIRGVRAQTEQDNDLLQTLVKTLALEALLGKGIRFLSSGQTRKVLIARALYAYRPDASQLLILDDPLESIDRDSRQRLTRCIQEHLTDQFSSLQLCRRQQDILPGVTHMALMARVEDELTIVQQGELAEVLASDSFADIVSRTPAVSKYLPLNRNNKKDTADEEQPLIQLDNVSVKYGDLVVLHNIQWLMKQNHHVLIEGPNGCGKSTLLSLIDGENHKGYGQNVFLFGRRKGSGETVWQVKAKFGVVSNELHNKYIKGWRVLDVVVSGFFDSVGLYDDSGSAESELATQWLAALGIEGLQTCYYDEISFGQQRLVLLARAMVKHPRILILDEPCVGLDDYHRQLILQTLDLIADQGHTQIIYVSHVTDEKPACINQTLTFIQSESGGYTLEQLEISL
ncbi:MAG: ABC transporter ATP-binding protein [SAR86 cluster bacterium]|uniref:ABC transporter ATP-binding protein n=1 Tax=SAR86 cluster bacterium TaxID=2030880 RepID=A0A2A5AVV3_9GAMM|nr:MAG: ABC transporter ATP-binding protein [SAR86 cluster bacterium]